MKKDSAFNEDEIFAIEMALRIVLCGLLNRNKDMAQDVSGVALNMSNGVFGGDKINDAKFWINYLPLMKDALSKISPSFYENEIKQFLLDEKILDASKDTHYKQRWVEFKNEDSSDWIFFSDGKMIVNIQECTYDYECSVMSNDKAKKSFSSYVPKEGTSYEEVRLKMLLKAYELGWHIERISV